ncbi:hypothetical protein M011DRAFT_491618 [Sporormia fimetaria CBS 119925]|uniref:ARID domain-containing protein n=1 Tax=Sporormia fimetaria CBS 119925 TaxID=1340428 RepID=A0A6A6VNP9_9PLEO|nr:hypothetical protein M011DRAFT_491618 [Sporormia fimetaria CBS 119925]
MDFQSPQNGVFDTSFVDPSAIANNQMNGARPYPMPSIPQKRDSTGAALSRSQTPSQQPQFGFPQPFTHTPSPTMQNQQFRPGQGVPQRMQSPAHNPLAPQMSPMGFSPTGQMGPGFDPNTGAQYPAVRLSQNLQHRQQEAQRQWQLQNQAQQQQQLSNLASSNVAAQQRLAGQVPGMPMQHPGMQRPMMPGRPHDPRAVFNNFLGSVASLYKGAGRPFNPQPTTANRVINLQQLYSCVSKIGSHRIVTSTNRWPQVAQMMGIDPNQFTTAPAELRNIYEQNLVLAEEFNQRRQRASQVAQMGQLPPQMSPTRPQLPGAANSSAVSPEYLQQLQKSKLAAAQQTASPSLPQPPPQPSFDPTLQSQPQFENTTPAQNNASLATVNGRSTPQAEIKPPGVEQQHRKSISRQMQGTPDPSPVGQPAPPGQEKVKEETMEKVKVGLPTDMVEGKMTYRPSWRIIDRYTGLDFDVENFEKRVTEKVGYMPNVPALSELGVIDFRALTMSIRSGLHSEVRLALDILVKLTIDPQVQLELERCEDLVEVIVDYGEDLLDNLANDNPEVTDILDLSSYEDVYHHRMAEMYSLQDHPEFGSKAFDLDRTADRLLAITTIFRNLSFLEINHAALSTPQVLKFCCDAIRLVGTRILLLRTHANTFDFMKDLVTFFSNISTKVVLPSREDAYAILHFLCSFAPNPRPTVPIKFTAYDPRIHRCLPAAVDSLAKLLARDDPNRTFYKQIFINEATSTPPYDLLTRAFSLAIAVIPDRTSGPLHQLSAAAPGKVQHFETRIAELRKPYLMQGMLAADILASLAPGPETGVCQSWLDSEDGWSNSLLKFAMGLCAQDMQLATHIAQQQAAVAAQARGGRAPLPDMQPDIQGYQLIVHRALSMLKRLGEKSKGVDLVKGPVQQRGHSADGDVEIEEEDEDEMETLEFGGSSWRVRADVLPRKETLVSALLMHGLDGQSVKQFCGIGLLDEGR